MVELFTKSKQVMKINAEGPIEDVFLATSLALAGKKIIKRE